MQYLIKVWQVKKNKKKKEHIEISNNLKFGVYRAYIERDTAILEFLNGCTSLTENWPSIKSNLKMTAGDEKEKVISSQ